MHAPHPHSFLLPLFLQGLPRTYNKDLQEDKEPLFDTVGTVHDCLRIAAGVVATMTPNADNLRAQLVPEMLATDLADYLVRKVGALLLCSLPHSCATFVRSRTSGPFVAC